MLQRMFILSPPLLIILDRKRILLVKMVMGKRCSIKSCPGNVSGVKLFKLPTKETDRAAWQKFIFTANGSDASQKTVYVCSRHFNSCCFSTSALNNSRLVAGHHPTLLNGKVLLTENETLCKNLPLTMSLDCNPMEMNIGETLESETELLPINDKDDAHDLKQQLELANQALHFVEETLRQTNLKLRQTEAELKTTKTELSAAITDKTLLSIRLQRLRNAHHLKATKNKSLSRTKDRLIVQLGKKRKIISDYEDKHGRKKSKDNDSNPSKIRIVCSGTEKAIRGSKYPPELRDLSFKMHYAGPKGYKVFRKQVEKGSVPHPRTFYNWTKQYSAKPGFIPTALNYVKTTVENSPEQKLFAMSIDEVSMRKQLLRKKSGWVGYVDYGGLTTILPPKTLAKNALFFFLTEINGTKRFPIAYVLTDGLSAELISSMIKTVLIELGKINARVLTLTFDGLPANFAAAEMLGADLSIGTDHFCPYFTHPSFNSEKIHIIADTCHMIKLLRNTLKEYSALTTAENKMVEWRFIDNLMQLQSTCGIRSANKLTVRHVRFENQKMKVNLAVQTFSHSVACSLEVCRKIGLEGFEDVEGTIEFLKLIDRVFDSLNSTTKGSGYKATLSKENMMYWMPLFSKATNYLLGLTQTTTGKPLYKTKRGTCIKGLIITMKSIETIFYDCVLPQSAVLTHIPGYGFSQDGLELFFSALRCRFGRNNNPNAAQLEYAVKAMMCSYLDLDLNGNCTAQELLPTNIATLSPLSSVDRLLHDDFTDERDSVMFEDDDDSNDESEESKKPILVYENGNLELYVNNATVYISGFVGKRLTEQLKCPSCTAALFPILSDMERILMDEDFILLNEKNNGGLFIPSNELVETCKLTEREIRKLQCKGISSIDEGRILTTVIAEADEQALFYEAAIECYDYDPHSNHRLDLLRSIVKGYCTVRLHYIAKDFTLGLIPETNRSTCTNAVKFGGN